MHRVIVFFNNQASRQQTSAWRKHVELILFRSQVDFVTASSKEEFQSKLRAVAEEDVDAIISVGGDGTFNTLLQELAGSGIPFLVIPAGTANDLAREMGITGRLTQAIQAIRAGDCGTIDLITVNGRYMATNGGIGLVADVAGMVNDLRQKIPGFRRAMSILGRHTYPTVLGARLTLPYSPIKVAVESNEFRGNVTTPLLLANNQPSIGGSFPIAPETSNNDGSFNVTIFTHTSRARLIAAIYRVRCGLSLDADPDVIQFETARIKLKANEPVNFFGDGDFLVQDKELILGVVPKSITLFRPYCAPQSSKKSLTIVQGAETHP